MADINKTYTSNTLYNDSTGVIAFAEQLKQELINWANYHHVTEELGPDNRPDTQNALNNLFLSVYERFLTFLNDADATEKAINTWKEIENFLADYTDEKTLAEIVAELNANIESRLTVPLESTTGSSTTSTMTQKAITETIDASKTFTTGEKVDNVGIDSEPIAGSDNLVKSGGVQKELALGVVYDVSAHNGGAVFESLSALLSNANLNTLIPTAVRKGGMSIKFIQGSVPSSDNKYVQYICKTSTWSSEPTNWEKVNNVRVVQNTLTIGGEDKGELAGKLVESQEWIWVVADNAKRILFGIHKVDGSVYFGYGCPPQIVDYILEKIGDFNPEYYDTIKSFLGDLIDGDNLTDLLNSKVDKIEGKSLIDTNFADNVSTINNQEYISILTDIRKRLLEDITSEGVKEIHIPTAIADAVFVKRIQNQDWIELLVDKKGRIIEGTRMNGMKVFPAGIEGIEERINDYNNTVIKRNIDKDTAIRATATKVDNADILPLSFIHVSDIHTKSDNYKCFVNCMEYLQYYDKIKFAIVTGDLVWDSYADQMTWYDRALEKTTKPVLNVIGNHDAGQYVASLGLASVSTDKQCYDKFIAPYISKWGVVQPEDAEIEGKSYYYKDFADEKIRLIVLNEFETDYEIDPNNPDRLLYSREYRAMRQEQVDWFIESLSSTPDDYGVIVSYHQPDALKDEDNQFVSVDITAPYRTSHGKSATIAAVYCTDDAAWLPKIIQAFANKTSLSLTVTQIGAVVNSSATLVCDCDFTNVQSEFICILNGHTHKDYIGHNYQDLNVLCVGADNLLYTSYFQPREKGSRSEDLFNVVNIDRNRKTIKIIRIGSDASITGQVREQMILHYNV